MRVTAVNRLNKKKNTLGGKIGEIKMKRLLIVLLCLFLLVGCTSDTPSLIVEDFPTEEVVVETGEEILSVNVKGFPGVGEGYGLWGSVVTVDNAYPGWSGSAPVTIVNGGDQRRTFHLMFQQPGTTIKEGYKPFPEEYFSWMTIEDPNPEVAIGGEKKVSVTLSIPYDFPSEMRGESYEIRILVEDWSQTGFVQLALQAKWLITFFAE